MIGNITGIGRTTQQNTSKKLYLVAGHCSLRYGTNSYVTIDVYLYCSANSSNELNTASKVASYIWNNGIKINHGSYVTRLVPCIGGDRTSTSGGSYISTEFIYVESSTATPGTARVYGVSTYSGTDYPYPKGDFILDSVQEV